MFEEIPKNCKYAYVRVSYKSQHDNSSLESQKEEFMKLGVPEKIFELKSGPLPIILRIDLFSII